MARRKAKSQQLIVPDKVRQPSGLKRDGTPNAYWRRFEERLNNFDQIPLEKWQAEEALGYLLKRYRDHYGISFSLSYSGPPTKCPEMYCVRRIMTMIGSEDGDVLKEYIDWVFDKIIKPKKTSITSLGFFFTLSICNQFKAVYRKNHRITKTTELPNKYKEVAQQLELSANTYGDLAFAKMAVDSDPDSYASYAMLFNRLRDMGFNAVMLNNLEE